MKYCLQILFFLSQLTMGQNVIKSVFSDSTNLVFSEFVGIDSYQDSFFIKENVLHKKSKNQNWVYKNISLGKIHKVDIINPLQLIVLYKDFNAVVLLDNQLNETNRIFGNSLETPIAFEYIGLASGNQFWFFDVYSRSIGLYHFKNNTFKFISTPLQMEPKNYATNYNEFLWIDANNEFFSINLFGKIKKLDTIPKNDTVFIINEKQILINDNGILMYYNVNDKKSYKIEHLENSFVNFFFKDGILSIFTQNKITNYKLILP